MNKFQKKLHVEIKEFRNYSRMSYRNARMALKIGRKFNTWSPCDDCDNMWCKRVKNKLAFCKDNM